MHAHIGSCSWSLSSLLAIYFKVDSLSSACLWNFQTHISLKAALITFNLLLLVCTQTSVQVFQGQCTFDSFSFSVRYFLSLALSLSISLPISYSPSPSSPTFLLSGLSLLFPSFLVSVSVSVVSFLSSLYSAPLSAPLLCYSAPLSIVLIFYLALLTIMNYFHPFIPTVQLTRFQAVENNPGKVSQTFFSIRYLYLTPRCCFILTAIVCA